MAIKLYNDQSANPHECGSCGYFDRRDGGGDYERHGLCLFRFPPNKVFMRRAEHGTELQEVDFRTVMDTDGCSLYEPKTVGAEPVQYEKVGYWHAGEPSR